MLNKPKLMDWNSRLRTKYALNFLGGILDSSLTFTRASTATYYNSAGVLTQASTNIPRFDYNPATLVLRGLLLEQSSTNLFINSSVTNGTGWTITGSPTITTNNAGAPDGTATFNQWTRTTTASSYNQQSSAKATSSLPFAYSVYAKQGTVGKYLALRLQGIYPNRSDVVFDLSNGTIATSVSNGGAGFTGSASIQAIGGSVYRCTISSTTSDTGAVISGIFSFNSNNQQVDGTDSVSNSNGYVWGNQFEQLPFATSYIPTTSATVTRAADSLVNSSIGAWFNTSKGTMFATGIVEGADSGTNPALADFNDGTVNNEIYVSPTSNGTGASAQQINTSGVGAGLNNGTVAFGSISKVGMSFDGTTLAASTNGSAVTTTLSGIPTVNRIYFGMRGNSANWYNGWIRSFTYYNTALTNAQLQTISGQL